MKIPHAAVVVVSDGQKYLMLENRGDRDLIDLRVCAVGEHGAARTGEIGSERPGRYRPREGRRSAVEQTDWKSIRKGEFSAQLAAGIDRLQAAGDARGIVIMADARTLGTLRRHLHPRTRAAVMREIEGDFVNQTVEGIEMVVDRAE